MSLTIRLRRVRIEPEAKREEYIRRLERLIAYCENVIEREDIPEEIRLRAIDVIVRIIRMSYVMVRDIDIENVEAAIELLKQRLEELEGSETSPFL